MLRAAIALLTVAASVSDARAAAEAHDGFFLRLAVGRGAFAATMPEARDDADARLIGNGVAFDLAIGAAVVRDLVVHADFAGCAAREPRLAVGSNLQNTVDQTAALNAIGAGVTWYFGPNAYVSGSLGAARLTLYDVDDTMLSQTGRGPSLHALLGREWWVAPEWGLGAAAALFMGWLPDDGETWRYTSLGVLFSATLN